MSEPKRKRKIPIIFRILLVLIGVFVLYDLGWSIGLHGIMFLYDLPEGAEVILKPNIGHFCCSCGNRTNIEMVYRIPESMENEIEYGSKKIKGFTFIESPFYDDCNLDEREKYGMYTLNPTDECDFVYDYYLIYSQCEEYDPYDDYVYVHVMYHVSFYSSYDNIFTFPHYFIFG